MVLRWLPLNAAQALWPVGGDISDQFPGSQESDLCCRGGPFSPAAAHTLCRLTCSRHVTSGQHLNRVALPGAQGVATPASGERTPPAGARGADGAPQVQGQRAARFFIKISGHF